MCDFTALLRLVLVLAFTFFYLVPWKGKVPSADRSTDFQKINFRPLLASLGSFPLHYWGFLVLLWWVFVVVFFFFFPDLF